MYSVVLRALVVDTDTFSSQHILSVSTQTLSQQVSLLLGALRACSHRGACQMFGCVPSPATSCALTPPATSGGLMVAGTRTRLRVLAKRVCKTITGLR